MEVPMTILAPFLTDHEKRAVARYYCFAYSLYRTLQADVYFDSTEHLVPKFTAGPTAYYSAFCFLGFGIPFSISQRRV